MADGDSTQSGAGETQSGTADDTTTTAQTGTEQSTQSGGETTQTDTEAQRARAEAESLRERMKAADARAAKFEQELRAIKDKDLPEAEKLKREHAEYRQQVENLQKTNQNLALQVAFLSDNTYSWHNPDRALKLVDLSKVEIDAEGRVTGLKDALKALATSDPYLIKAEVKQEEKQQTPPGTAPGNNGTSGANKPTGAKLESRFPVMRTRVQR